MMSLPIAIQLEFNFSKTHFEIKKVQIFKQRQCLEYLSLNLDCKLKFQKIQAIIMYWQWDIYICKKYFL